MRAPRKYWLYQALAWGGYSAVSSTISAQYVGWRPPLVIGYVLYALYSIAFTDLFRRLMHRRGWLDLPALPRLLRLAPGILLIGMTQTFLVFMIDTALLERQSVSWPLSAVLGLWGGTTMATWTWTGVYSQIIRSQRRREREVQMQLAVREAELRALESQINPHFLFNCLNSIRALVVENPPRAQDMLTRFANILRHNLQRDHTHTASLGSEIEAASDYLALEAVRFEERLRVRLEIDPSTTTVPIPTMLLQTLVENAVKHGIAAELEGGDLIIRASREAGSLLLEVENTGHLSEPRPGGKPVGLANARERLRLLYGDRASLQLKNGATGMVTASVHIPLPS
jgi:two-component system LytT family sensor kinase